MATQIFYPGDDIVTGIQALNPGDKAVLTKGTYDAGGNIVKDGVEVHAKADAIIRNVDISGNVTDFKFTGDGEFHTTACDIVSTGDLTFEARYVKATRLDLSSPNNNIDIDTIEGDLFTFGYTNLSIDYLTGNLIHDPLVDDAGAYFNIKRFGGELLEVINFKCELHITVQAIIAVPPKATFNLNGCSGTVMIMESNKGNSLNVLNDSSIEVYYFSIPFITMQDGSSKVVVKGKPTDELHILSNITLQDFELIGGYTSGINSDSAHTVFVSSGVDMVNVIEKSNPIIIFDQSPNFSSEDGGGGGTGTSFHPDLSGRNVDDQHPISAISNLQVELDSKEDDLGDPLTDGQVLSSLTDGTRSWIDAGGGTDDCCVEWDGGNASSIYVIPQLIDGGNAA